MTSLQNKNQNKKFKKITERIIKKYKPEKIILFGSWAWGRPKSDSDVDLFVVKDTKENPWRCLYKIRDYLDEIDEAFDIIVYTPKQLKKRLELGDYFIKDIIKKGKVLYEKQKK